MILATCRRLIYDFRFFDYEIIKEIEDKIFSRCYNLGYNSCLNVSTKSPSTLINNEDFIQLTYHLEEQDFVEVSYLIYLRRQPESQGRKFYSERLRKSELTRLEFIDSLKSSEEFKKQSLKPSLLDSKSPNMKLEQHCMN